MGGVSFLIKALSLYAVLVAGLLGGFGIVHAQNSTDSAAYVDSDSHLSHLVASNDSVDDDGVITDLNVPVRAPFVSLQYSVDVERFALSNFSYVTIRAPPVIS